MLWVVGTTNVGSAYNVGEMESALADRFMIARKDTDKKMVESVVTGICKKRKLGVRIAKKLIKFFDNLTRMYSEQNMITNDINLRHICEIATFAKDKGSVQNEIRNFIPKWVGRDLTDPNGQLIQSEVDVINQLIDTIFGV